MGKFGYIQPMLIDERSGKLVAGHGRLERLQALKASGAAPPARIKVGKGKDWLVPVIRGVGFKSESEAEEYLLLDNRAVELGGWDDAGLLDMLEDLGKAGAAPLELGWEDDAFKELLRDVGNQGMEAAKEDEVPAFSSNPVTQPGDLWMLGRHRLLCGDSTDLGQVKVLMQGERAGLMNTDPPYGVSYANEDRPHPGVVKPRVAKPKIAKDDLQDEVLEAFLEKAFTAAKEALRPNAAWYVWHANLTQGLVAAATKAASITLHRQIIWVKPVLLLGRGQYHWKHEPCFMGWVQGNQPPDYGRGQGERDQTTVWEVGSVPIKERAEMNHATPKPVGLFAIPITKHLLAGELAYEPFAGTGPQFIAAEQLNRRCYGLELEPRYCDVIVKRWENLTGQKAVREKQVVRSRAAS